MANARSMWFTRDLYRQMIDKLTAFAVTAGGLAVLMALLLIVFYLFWVVFPLFTAPNVKLVSNLNMFTEKTPLMMGIDEKNQLGYRLSNNGELSIFQTQGDNRVILKQKWLDEEINSFYSSVYLNEFFGFGLANGEAQLQRLRFSRQAKANEKATPLLEILPRFSLSNSPIEDLSFAMTQEELTLAAISDNHLIVSFWQQNEQTSSFKMALNTSAKVQITPDGKQLYLLTPRDLSVFRIQEQSLSFQERILLVSVGIEKPQDIKLLPNNMLLMGLKNNETALWFDINNNGKRALRLAYRFDAQSSVQATEPYRSILATISGNKLNLWHFPSQKNYQLSLPKEIVKAKMLAFSSTGESILLEQDNKLKLFKIENLHPEINLASLWQKIQYQGESAPNFIWQSGANEAQMKVSLVPLIFGSIKAAFFALIIAAPIALPGAIYTAYFMPVTLRKWIKPMVELMSAFPTVILGFLASLVLAPWLEYHLLTLILFCLIVIIAFLFLALFWQAIPKFWRRKITSFKLLIFLMGLIILLGFASANLGEWITLYFYNGDGQAFINQILGVNIEQRNALVVGIAMGFAIIPTIFTISEDAMFSVPKHLTDASTALGATPWQTLHYVVLTTASSGIFSALIMGVSRAIGETMIVLMATGNNAIIDWNPLIGLRSLAANIAVEMPESVLNSSHFRVLFLTALLLFCFTFFFNTLAELVRERLRNKYSAL